MEFSAIFYIFSIIFAKIYASAFFEIDDDLDGFSAARRKTATVESSEGNASASVRRAEIAAGAFLTEIFAAAIEIFAE